MFYLCCFVWLKCILLWANKQNIYIIHTQYESNENLSCEVEECLSDLNSQLATIFLTQLIVSNAQELGVLWVKKVGKSKKIASKDKDMKSEIWLEYNSDCYGRTFDDYNELLIQFGYCSLFVISFPLAPVAGLISAIVEARIDGYKLCKLTQRPFPRFADNIGAWQFGLEFMGWATLITNLGLICFATDELVFPFGSSSLVFEEVMLY